MENVIIVSHGIKESELYCHIVCICRREDIKERVVSYIENEVGFTFDEYEWTEDMECYSFDYWEQSVGQIEGIGAITWSPLPI